MDYSKRTSFEITEYFDENSGNTGKVFQALDAEDNVLYERDYGSTFPDLFQMIEDYYNFLDKPKNSFKLKFN